MMKKSQSLNNTQFSKKYFVWIFAFIVLAISLLDLAGWAFDIAFLKSIDEHWIPMKVVTAACFILSSSVLMIIFKKTKSRITNIVSEIFTILILIISITSCWVHIVFLNTGNESLLSNAPVLKLFLASGNRMALFTAANFTIIGSIIVLLSFNKKC